MAQIVAPVASRAVVASFHRQRQAARKPHPAARSYARLTVRAYGHMAASADTTTGPKTFMDELRAYSMKLHTKEQAPKEGKAEQKEKKPWVPSREGYLAFLVESKVVYDAFEDIMSSAAIPAYKEFTSTGLERGEALARDIEHMVQTYGLTPPTPGSDGPGHAYAAQLRELAKERPPAFICHYYNFYFAHTAGGRMIGRSVSNVCLDGWEGDFYKWEGDVKELLNGVRDKINALAESWSSEERQACMEETPSTFKAAGQLVQLIAGYKSSGNLL